jgi:hypothetical protein
MFRKQFHSHKGGAKHRGIPFLLTYAEWLAIWEQSGHLHERGNRKGQYCMARYGDQGAYEVGNVRIVTNAENQVEAGEAHARGRARRAEWCKRYVEALKAELRAQGETEYRRIGRRRYVEVRM